MARKQALIWAIDDYPGISNDLPSCINDSLAFREILEDRYGFERSSIRLLHNQDATLANVSKALDDLFAGTQDGDQLVVYVSSHGWEFPEGDTMVQVLCCYDDFLRDTALVQKTVNLPPGCVTMVTDACNTGGLQKTFFPGGPNIEVARTKVWSPPPELEERKRQLLSQVNRIRLFGRSPSGEASVLSKNFSNPPIVELPRAKDLSAGAPLINAVLFTACQADETAAAGTSKTGYLSAFTYALREELDLTISVSDLRDRVAARLQSLNMTQDPQLYAPPTQPQRLARTFIRGDVATGPSPTSEPMPAPSPRRIGGDGTDWQKFLDEVANLIRQ